MSRCDSAAMVPNTSELFPEPETPVNTVSRRFGISTLTFLRLFTRAPCTRIRSWLSALWAAGIGSPSGGRRGLLGLARAGRPSAQLLDAHQVACGVAHGAVPDTVRLLGGLLDDVGVTGLQPLEGAVEVAGGQQQRRVGALGHHLDDRAA